MSQVSRSQVLRTCRDKDVLRANFLFVDLLLKTGANVNKFNGYGLTSLHTALSGPKDAMPSMIQTLIAHGADVNRSEFLTPLLYAFTWLNDASARSSCMLNQAWSKHPC